MTKLRVIGVDQRGAEQRRPIGIKMTIIHSINEIESGGVWVADGEIPALIADLDSKRGALSSEIAIPKVFNAGR